MYGQSVSYQGLQDPNINRLIEETINSVSDVERRLQGLKVGIAQAFPQLAPILQIREVQTRDQTTALLSRFSQQGGMGSLGGMGGVGGMGGLGSIGGMGGGFPQGGMGGIGGGFQQGGVGGGFQQGGMGGQQQFGTPFGMGQMFPSMGQGQGSFGYGGGQINPYLGVGATGGMGVSPTFPWGSFRSW